LALALPGCQAIWGRQEPGCEQKRLISALVGWGAGAEPLRPEVVGSGSEKYAYKLDCCPVCRRYLRPGRAAEALCIVGDSHPLEDRDIHDPGRLGGGIRQRREARPLRAALSDRLTMSSVSRANGEHWSWWD